MQRFTTKRTHGAGTALAPALLAGMLVLGGAAAWGASALPAEKVSLTVNGEPIRESDLKRNIPADAIQATVDSLRKYNEDRLIQRIELRQFLTAARINVTDAELEKKVAELRKMPPSMGCPCCRYGTLEEYLQANYLTMDDLKADTRNEIGMDRYIERLWKAQFTTPAKRAALIRAERARIEAEFTHGWHIFFNTFQQVGAQKDPAKLEAAARAKADAAWKRLQKGESFAAVARAMSEDQLTRDKGGDLGFTPRTAYGQTFEKTLASLKPGQVSKPFKSAYGYHIVKWAPVQESDLLQISKGNFVAEKQMEVLDQVRKAARIVRTP